MKNKMINPLICVLIVGILSGGLLYASDQGQGTFTDDNGGTYIVYSYTAEFDFTGDNAVKVKWDFGDGETVTKYAYEDDWKTVVHTYGEIQDYTMTQTAYSADGYSSVDTYTVKIMGPPVVTFDTNGGKSIPSIDVPMVKGEPQMLEDIPVPERSWYKFTGWYSDPEMTEEWKPEYTVGEHITLYAGWEFNYLPVIILAIAAISALALIVILIKRRSEEEP